jgi:uncharacterized membrane protein YhaH (DUF805 family)
MRLRELFSFQGRIGRKTFWLTFLALLGLLLLNFVVTGALMPSDPALAGIGGLIAMLGLIVCGLASLAIQVKRWHDLDRSGWMVLVSFIPVVGALVNLVCLGFLRGTPGPNRFGETGNAPAVRVAADDVPPVLPNEPPPVMPLRVPPKASAPMSPARRGMMIVAVVLVVVVPALGGLWWMLPGADWPARKSWLLAKTGSAAECHSMGLRCRKGVDGFRADDAEAAKWFERAAKQSHVQAQYDLAVLHFYGLGVPEDHEQARRWLESAVQQDYVPAMTLLGLLHEQAEPRSATSFELWQKAAAAGDPWAESLLGSAYLARSNPFEGDENFMRALYWLETARRDGVETVGGLLRHIWANLPAERVETVTAQVFARLERHSPEPGPETEAVAEASAPPATPAETSTPPAEEDATVTLRNDLLESVRALDDYAHISTLYAERSQADAEWAGTAEGRAVGQYLQRMRADAQSVRQRAEGDALTIDYSVSGAPHSENGIRAADFANDDDYHRFVVDSIARNIVAAPRPLAVSAFLREVEKKEEEAK